MPTIGNYQCACGSSIVLEVTKNVNVKVTLSAHSLRVCCDVCHQYFEVDIPVLGNGFQVVVSEKTRIAMKPAEKVGSIDE